jgi:hypothetical protein
MKKMTPAEDEKFARESVDLLRKQQWEPIRRELDPSVVSDPNAEYTIGKMMGMFPAGEPKSVKVVDVKFLRHQDVWIHSLTLEYEYPATWLLATVSIRSANGTSTIAGMNVTPIADSLESINRFSLADKSALHYLILGLAVALPIFCIYVLVVCLRTKNQKRKWLWAIFILFGVGRLAMNWTTGELTFTPLSVNIPCSSFTAIPAYGPWTVAVLLPLGAILFLIKQSKSTAGSPDSMTPTLSGDESPVRIEES